MSIQRGEIYFIDFGAARYDFGGPPAHPNKEPQKRRPAVVVSINPINALADRTIFLVTVVPGTKGVNVTRESPWQVRVLAASSGLPMETVFRAFQVRALDSRWISGRPAGSLTSLQMARLEEAIRSVLGLA